jgi:hypothetical protein
MQKIFVDKNDTAADVLKYLKATPDGLVMLVVPTESKLKTLASFRSLKKKGSDLKKNIIIESVDEKILSLANSAKLEAIHPFLSNFKNNSMADIILSPKASKDKKAPAKGKKPARVLKVKGGAEAPLTVSLKRGSRMPSLPKTWRRIWIPVAVFAVIFLSGLAMNVFFTKADITINFEKTPWNLEHTFVASTSVSGSGLGYAIPGQLLDQKKNMVQLFPASGKGQVTQKAVTQITIYNAYGTDPQRLVATTRFETPDGKIFHIDSGVVVPGATQQDGKLSPSSITVSATADKAGEEYNIGPISRLTIPGFAGTPKYQGFYGAIENGASGGFVGEHAVATDADVSSAQEKATQIFQAVFQNTFLASPPDGLKIIDGASQLRILKLTVDRNVNADGNFAVLGEAEFRSMAFKEEDLKHRVENLATLDYPDRVFESFSMSYRDAKPDFDQRTLVFTVEATGTLTTSFNPDLFKSEILGKSESDVHTLVLSIPHLTDAKVSLSPFWVKRVPEDKSKVTVTVR